MLDLGFNVELLKIVGLRNDKITVSESQLPFSTKYLQ